MMKKKANNNRIKSRIKKMIIMMKK